MERHPGLQVAAHEDHVAVFLDDQRETVERPGRVLEGARELRDALDTQTLVGDLRDLDEHVKDP